MEQAERLHRAGVQLRGEGGFNFELAVDEAPFPTTPQAHLFLTREVQRLGVRLSSLAPRFSDGFQKGIDFGGDLEAFRGEVRAHAALARALGHRLAVHAASDKFTVLPVIGEECRGRFHLKTSGTLWLEALRVAARLDPPLFRRIHRLALGTFSRSRALFPGTPELEELPDPSDLDDEAMVGLLEDADTRQVLHICFGEVLADPDLSRALFELLRRHLDEYRGAVEAHLGRHLDALGIPRGE